MEKVKEFYNALSSNEAMRERAKALYGKGIPADEAEAAAIIIAFAKSEGYDFTAEELKAAAASAKELTDEELENVAGGACKDTSTCACAIGGGGTKNGISCACAMIGASLGKPGPALCCNFAGWCIGV